MSAALMHDVDPVIVDIVEEHAFSETSREVGGVLIGTFDDDAAHISAAMPALRAVGSSAQVTFTHEVWDDVLSTIERDHPGERIVGWYHSHPGFGIFLSEYDLFLHRSFFSDPRMLAFVVDPLAGRSGWFGWQDDEIVELATEPTRRAGVRAEPGAARHDGGSTRRRAGGAALLAALGIAAVFFGVGYALAPDSSTGKTRQLETERDAAVRDRDALLAQRTAPTVVPAPVPVRPNSAPVRYRVRTGDTLSSLAQAFYGDTAAAPRLAAVNHIGDPRLLKVGDILIIKAQP